MKLIRAKWSGDPSADRDKFIGGSDIGAILGLNPWKSAYTLWAEKSGRIEVEDISDKEAVWWGTNMEELVAKRFCMKTGKKVKKTTYEFSCKEYPFLVAHVDRLGVGEKFVLECKTTSARNRMNYNEGEIPPMHYAQVQFYLMLTGYKVGYLATKRDSDFYITKIDRNDEFIEDMKESAIAFWQMVQDGIEPDIDDSESTERTINQMYPESIQDVMDLTDYRETIESRVQIAHQIKSLESIKRQCDSVLKSVMQDCESAVCDEYTVSWKTNAKGTRVFTVKEKNNGRN